MLSYTAIIIEWINLSPGNAISLGPIDLNHQVHRRAGNSILSCIQQNFAIMALADDLSRTCDIGGITQWCSIEIIVEQTRAIE
jgi:hypothetical protein